MRYFWIEDINKFKKISKEWDNALLRSGQENPFLLSSFIITWWKYYHVDSQLRIFIIYKGDEIIGGVPLFVKQEGAKFAYSRVMSFVGGAVANYTEPLYVTDESEILHFLIEALAEKKDWDLFYLSDLRENNKLLSEYRQYTQDRRFMLYTVATHQNWAIDLSAGMESYMATISSKLRRDLRAKRKHAVNNYGEIKIEKIKGKAGVERYYDLYTKFSSHSFSSRNRISNFQNDKYSSFFKEFLVLMDKDNRLESHVLFAGDHILAVSFAYRFGKGFNWVLTSFNYKYKYVRPGYLLIEELIKEIIRQGETYYNWYGHERFYKSQWCNEKTELYRFYIIRPTIRGACFSNINWIENKVRANKTILNAFKKLKFNWQNKF